MVDGNQADGISEVVNEAERGAKTKKTKSWPKTLGNGEKEKLKKAKKPDDDGFVGHVTSLRVGLGKETPVTLDFKTKKGERKSVVLDSSDATRFQAMVSIIAAAQSTRQKLRFYLSKSELGSQMVRVLELRRKN